MRLVLPIKDGANTKKDIAHTQPNLLRAELRNLEAAVYGEVCGAALELLCAATCGKC